MAIKNNLKTWAAPTSYMHTMPITDITENNKSWAAYVALSTDIIQYASITTTVISLTFYISLNNQNNLNYW